MVALCARAATGGIRNTTNAVVTIASSTRVLFMMTYARSPARYTCEMTARQDAM